jgi:ferrous iron transport protein B
VATVAARPRRGKRPHRDGEPLVVCLAGNPNVGKTSLFNGLTGASGETANYAGVSVVATSLCTRWGETAVEVVDLPGAYALEGPSGDQRAARDELLARRPDVVVAVADATNLARSLYLPLQLIDLGYRVALALNLTDEARRRHREPDGRLLGDELGVPVVPTVAPRGHGLPEIQAATLEVAAIDAAFDPRFRERGTPLPPAVEARLGSLAEAVEAHAGAAGLPGGLSPRAVALAVLEGDATIAEELGLLADGTLTPADDGLAVQIAKARHAEASRLAAAAQAPPRAGSDTLWRLTTSPRTGIPILIGVVAAMFATLFAVGEVLSRILTGLWTAFISPAVIDAVHALLGTGVAARIVLWGVDGGILATLAVGIPYILTFYLILAVVEDSGYMNAAAFLSDRVMHRFGLHGRAVMPLIAAGGCNVPAVIATRTLSNPRERFIASVLATLTPCSARTAVIIGAVAGVAGWQYALLTYAVLLVVMVGAGLVLNRMLPGEEGPLVMEMFPFRRPVVRQVLRKTWRRFREFVWDAAPIILLGSMALGALYETGLVWKLEPIMAPVVQGWLMLPAVAGLTLLFAVLRKEMALQLLLVFAAVQAGGAVVSISTVMTTSQIVTYAIVNAIYIPCLATITVLGRVVGWKRTAFISMGTIVLALAVGGVVARLLPLLGA